MHLISQHRRPTVMMAVWLCYLGMGGHLSPAQTPEFKPRTVIDRAFPAIQNVTHSSLEAANQELDDDELVLGVEIDGQAVAYPINMLTGPQREIINDELANIAIAATW